MPESMIEGIALYQGEQKDGSHDISVRLTVLHADPALDHHLGVILRVDSDLFQGLSSDSMVPIIRVSKKE